MGTPIKVDELSKLFAKDKYKYICLKNSAGDFEIRWNRHEPKSNEKKFKEIQDFLKRDSITSGIYYFVHKDSHLKGSAENVIPIGVGSYNSQTEVIKAPQQYIQTKIESVWTPAQAVEILTDKNRAEMELEAANDVIEQLQSELEKKNSVTLNEGTSTSSLMNDIKGLGEFIFPALDKYFDLQEKKLKLMQLQLGNSQPVNRLQGSQRSDGGVHPSSPEYDSYLERIFSSDNEQAQDMELDYLETNFPIMYLGVCTRYNIDITEEEIE